MVNKLTNSLAADGRICSFLLLRCSVVVSGMEGRYLWSAVVGGGRGKLFLAVAGDVGCSCWRQDRGEMLICRLPLAEFAICFFCVVVWVFVGSGGDGFGGVPSLALSLARMIFFLRGTPTVG